MYEWIGWLGTAFALVGSTIGSRPRKYLNGFYLNLFYMIADIISIVYFVLPVQMPYLVLNLVYMWNAVIGLKNNHQYWRHWIVPDTEKVLQKEVHSEDAQ